MPYHSPRRYYTQTFLLFKLVQHTLEKGTKDNLGWNDVKGYLQDGDNVKPPTGSAYVNGTAEEIDATSYAVTSTNDGYRATLKMKTSGEKTAGDFTTKTSSTNGSGQGSSSSGDNTGSGNE